MTGSGEGNQPIGDALNEHHAYLRGLARSLIGDAHGADDLVQETAKRALESPPRHAGNLRAWLATVARRLAMRSGVREGSRKERESQARTAQPLPSPDALAAQAEIQRKIAEAVGQLDEPYRSTIMLRFFESLEPDEIAARSGEPVKTVYTRVRRGLDQLRGILDAEHPGGRREWTLALLPVAFGHDAVQAAHAALAAGTAGAAGAKSGWAASVATSAALGIASFGVGWVTAPDSGSVSPGPIREVVADPGEIEQPDVVAPADPDESGPGATKPVEPQDYLRRIEEAATWKDAREIGREIARLPDAEGRDVLLRVFGEVTHWRYRKHLLDAFAWPGVHSHAAEIFALGSHDPHFRVRERAHLLAGDYLAFQDFSQEPEAFREWYATVEGLNLPELIERSTLLCADRLRALDGELFEMELEAFANANLLVDALWIDTGVDVPEILRRTGLEATLRNWAFDDRQRVGARAIAMQLIAHLDRDPEFLAARFLPVLDDPTAHDPRILSAALRAFRNPDCHWALDRLRAVLPRLRDEQSRAAWSWTLAKAGGKEVLPELVALRIKEGRSSPCSDALYELGGILLDELPSNEWWEKWLTEQVGAGREPR